MVLIPFHMKWAVEIMKIFLLEKHMWMDNNKMTALYCVYFYNDGSDAITVFNWHFFRFIEFAFRIFSNWNKCIFLDRNTRSANILKNSNFYLDLSTSMETAFDSNEKKICLNVVVWDLFITHLLSSEWNILTRLISALQSPGSSH